MTDAELNAREAVPNAPPEYGRHQLDELYNDISHAGFMSRAPSGSSTPFYAQSRRGSHENLQSLGAVANSLPTGEVNSALLQSRLANLQTNDHASNYSARTYSHHSPSGGNTPLNGLDIEVPGRHSPYFAAASYNGSGTHSSQRASPPHHSPAHGSLYPVHDSDEEIHQADFDLGTLSRVPSYGFATRSSGAMTPYTDGPPSYIDATSRPPSPVHIQRPNAAHVRSGVSTPSSMGSQSTVAAGPSQLSLLHHGHVLPTGTTRSHRTASGVAEDEARLRMMRARAS